jgi:DNA-binding transcriptional regulator YiaG
MLLSEFKKQSGMSFQDLAHLFQTSRASVYFWAQGTRLPCDAKLRLIQKKTGNKCTVDEMKAHYYELKKLKK